MAIDTLNVSARHVVRTDAERLALAALAGVLLAVSALFVVYRSTGPSDGSDIGDTGIAYASGGISVVPHVGHRGAGVFEPGDEVTEIAGRSVEAWAAALLDPTVARPSLAVGETLGYVVDRDGRSIELTVPLRTLDLAAPIGAEWGVLVFAFAMQIVGLALFALRPREPAARALLVAGTGMFASSVPWAIGLQAVDLVDGAGFWLYAIAAGFAYSLFWSGALHFALVFPRPVPFAASRARILALAYAIPLGAQVALIVGAAVATGRALPALEAWLVGQLIVQPAVIIATLGLMTFSYVRLADPASRQQLRWVAASVPVVAISSLVLWFGPEAVIGQPLLPRSAVALLGLPFPIALGLAISRHHLFDLDVVVNRSVVYGGLTAGVIATYAATVAVLGGFIPGNAPFALALLGAGAVAVVALPLRDGLQRSVNRVMYGDRDDPDRALRRLGHRLEASLDPQMVLPTLVETVADALRSPYVAIELEADGGSMVQAVHGTVPVDAGGPRDLVRLPISYNGRQVGRLALSPRGPGERFGAADERLLADLARQAAPAVEAVRLTADLRRSREELVATREEERRRLRRDLHDELGPSLAGTLMKLAAARSLLDSDADRSRNLLDDLQADTRGMIDEIRRIAHNLRPPALDELGLLGALRQHAATFDGGPPERPLHVAFDAPDELAALPAAVEVAALRIALEGLTNAARHSGASRARVSLAMEEDALVVTVTDDGGGIPDAASRGVGLTSMRERADELGGSLDVLAADGGGTTVVARLPVTAARQP